MDKTRILIVDDELSMRQFLEILLKKEGYEVTTAENGDVALQKMQKGEFAVVLMDYNMPESIDGIELLNKIRRLRPMSQVVIITAYASTEQAIKAIELGALDYVSKPFNVAEIKDIVKRAANEYHAKAHTTGAADAGAEGSAGQTAIVAESPAMKKVLQYAAQVAPTDSIVLVTGESGVGKEIIARYIHNNGIRKGAPWYPINCGAIPESLQESELFGYEKGAFTGADKVKRGYFEVVGNGTLFLDEIGELSENMQVRLLRVLQERVFMRVGGVEKLQTHARLIAATNRDLHKEVERGRFREDLFFRLNVFEIYVPPLRERREDILPLTMQFIEELSARLGRTTQLDEEVKSFLLQYPFAGNVRELHNIIERAFVLSTGPTITMREVSVRRPADPVDGHLVLTAPVDLDAVLADTERRYVAAALEKTNRNRHEAALLLGITERSLRYRMDKLGVKDGANDV